MEKIQDFLETYQELWWDIAESDTSYPVNDIWFEKCDDSNFYGTDLSGKNAVYPIFFSGSSNYFAAIWVKDEDTENIEKYPVYIFDLPSFNSEKLESVGNFKKFIRLVIDEYKSNNDADIDEQFYKDLDSFSDELINNDDYQLKINE